MSAKETLRAEIESTRDDFLCLIESIPESMYEKHSGNPAWTVGDVLYHLSLGPRALTLEVNWLVRAPRLYQFLLDHFPLTLFNRVNAWFTSFGARKPTRTFLANKYEKAHTELMRVFEKTQETDYGKFAIYPAIEESITGRVSVEQLLRYVKHHYETHAAEIQAALKQNQAEAPE
jgi:uncharacterized damage-inducible protein DinB